MKKSFLSQARTGKRNDIFEVQSFRRFWKSLQIKSGYHRRFVDGYYIECIYCTYIYTVYIYMRMHSEGPCNDAFSSPPSQISFVGQVISNVALRIDQSCSGVSAKTPSVCRSCHGCTSYVRSILAKWLPARWATEQGCRSAGS